LKEEKMERSSLGDRMKAYETASRSVLVPRMPVIVRVDGKAFHTYTRSLSRPWSEELMLVMDTTAAQLCSEVDGAIGAYVQSDEISILIHPYRSYEQQPWFRGQIQKVVSVTASIASATFTAFSPDIFGEVRPAYFDSRAFVLPEKEVCNYFIWRQQDWERNSVQMLARSMFSHKSLHGKGRRDILPMCHDAGQPWGDLPTYLKRGRCVVREKFEHEDGTTRNRWVVDREIPIFKEDRRFWERHFESEE
jgi:tRNA(His) 5'-end guanylyltransferase